MRTHYSKLATRCSLFAALTLILASCASEDPSIVNPPPGNANVVVRFFNLVPDGKDRKLVMEQGYQTLNVASGMFSATVNAPADSSFIDIVSGTATELRTPTRVRFTRQSVYDIIAVPKVGLPSEFDTIMVSNANRSLTTQPVAQVRAIHAVPDTSFTLDVRSGCPNGPAVTTTPVRFRETSLYHELPPGSNVFSVQQVTPSGTTIVGTFECTLSEYTPYSILYYLDPETEQPQLTLIDEADFTTNATRSFVPVTARDADVRVFNLGPSSATVNVRKSGQLIASNVTEEQLSGYASVPTCEQQEPDVFVATFADGSTATDSTALTVRGRYTIITADTNNTNAMVLVPPAASVFGAAGKAIVRVVNAADRTGGVAVAVGAQTNVANANGYSSGVTLAQDIRFGQVSDPTLLIPGITPLTVTTAAAPTSVISIRTTELVADRAYLIVLSSEDDGSVRIHVFDETDQPGMQGEIHRASLYRFLDGSPVNANILASVGDVVRNAKVYYRNSFTTTIPLGTASVLAGGTSVNTVAIDGKRTLNIYTIHEGNENIIDIVTDPLRQQPGVSDRRVINVTADVPQVSIAYDTAYASNPDVPHVARNVAFGEVSPTHVLDREVRGSMYVYDSNTLKRLYTLPIDLGPLGNSYTLVVAGTKQSGYEVIVLQEF